MLAAGYQGPAEVDAMTQLASCAQLIFAPLLNFCAYLQVATPFLSQREILATLKMTANTAEWNSNFKFFLTGNTLLQAASQCRDGAGWLAACKID